MENGDCPEGPKTNAIVNSAYFIGGFVGTCLFGGVIMENIGFAVTAGIVAGLNVYFCFCMYLDLTFTWVKHSVMFCHNLQVHWCDMD